MDYGVETLLSKHLENAKAIFRLQERGMFVCSAGKGRELENNNFFFSLFFFCGELNKTNVRQV